MEKHEWVIICFMLVGLAFVELILLLFAYSKEKSMRQAVSRILLPSAADRLIIEAIGSAEEAKLEFEEYSGKLDRETHRALSQEERQAVAARYAELQEKHMRAERKLRELEEAASTVKVWLRRI